MTYEDFIGALKNPSRPTAAQYIVPGSGQYDYVSSLPANKVPAVGDYPSGAPYGSVTLGDDSSTGPGLSQYLIFAAVFGAMLWAANYGAKHGY